MTDRSNIPRFAVLATTAVIVAVAAVVVMGRIDDQPIGEPVAQSTDTETDAPSWLFTQTASAGSFSEQGDGTGTLTLTSIDADVTAFTDRPDRDTVLLRPASLVAAWPSLFADSAPNAVLVNHGDDGTATSFVLELSDPAIDGTTMTYTATVVRGHDHAQRVPGMVPAPSAVPPEQLHAVSLFIDDASRGTDRNDDNGHKGAVVHHTPD